jgi:hypothetical protein
VSSNFSSFPSFPPYLPPHRSCLCRVGTPLPKNWREKFPALPLAASNNSELERDENDWAASKDLPSLDVEDLSVMPALRNLSVGKSLYFVDLSIDSPLTTP